MRPRGLTANHSVTCLPVDCWLASSLGLNSYGGACGLSSINVASHAMAYMMPVANFCGLNSPFLVPAWARNPAATARDKDTVGMAFLRKYASAAGKKPLFWIVSGVASG